MFAFASLMLNITPGSDMLYVATRSTTQGIKAGVFSSLGIMVGCLVHIFAAVLGLSLIIAKSALAFNIIKYVGATYLVYLGLMALFSKKTSDNSLPDLQPLSHWKIFTQGVWTNILNPKVAIFFLAFLPQFILPNQSNTQIQILWLGLWFDFSGTIVNILVAILFGKLGNWLVKYPLFAEIQEKITGIVLILLGIRIAVLSRK
jgi:threonine/homoserine/homoserine lactone efflux protein